MSGQEEKCGRKQNKKYELNDMGNTENRGGINNEA